MGENTEPYEKTPDESRADLAKDLRVLGEGKTEYSFDTPTPELLEAFPNPARENTSPGMIAVQIQAPEFTSVCPKTGQPDFASIEVEYAPDKWCVESKSFKLYIMGFRNHGAFHEDVVNQIGEALRELLEPLNLQVIGKFTPRGGITFWPLYKYARTQRVIPGA